MWRIHFWHTCLWTHMYLYPLSGLQREWAVLSEDGQRAGEHSAQHPVKRYHPETHVFSHPGLQVINDAPESHRNCSESSSWNIYRLLSWVMDEAAEPQRAAETSWWSRLLSSCLRQSANCSDSQGLIKYLWGSTDSSSAKEPVCLPTISAAEHSAPISIEGTESKKKKNMVFFCQQDPQQLSITTNPTSEDTWVYI